MITGEQVKAARKLLGWSANGLASRSYVRVTTICKLEASEPGSAVTVRVEKLQKVLEAAGIEFTAGDGPGVRLRKQPRTARAYTWSA